jgi:hypothetical protein
MLLPSAAVGNSRMDAVAPTPESDSGMAGQDCLDVLSGAVAARRVRCIFVRQHSAIVVMPSDPP